MNNEPLPDPEQYVMFADGSIVSIWNVRKVIVDGRSMIEFEFRPTPGTRYNHPDLLSPDKYDNKVNQTFIRQYPEEYCYLVNPSTRFQTWWVFTSLDGKDTNFLNSILADARIKIETLIKENISLKKAKARIEYERKQMLEHLEEFEAKYDEKIKRRVNAVIPGGSTITEDEVIGTSQ